MKMISEISYLMLPFRTKSVCREVGSFNTPSWSISTEFWVNTVFVFSIFALKDKIFKYAAILMVICPCWILIFWTHGWISAPKFMHIDSGIYRTLAGFFAGVFVQHIHREYPSILSPIRSTVLMMISLLSMSIILIFSRNNYVLEAATAVIVFPLLVFSLVNMPSIAPIASMQPLRWLGDVSYSIYLWQLPIAVLITNDNVTRWIEADAKIGLIAAYIAALALVSDLSFRFYEMPVRNRINSAGAAFRKSRRNLEQN